MESYTCSLGLVGIEVGGLVVMVAVHRAVGGWVVVAAEAFEGLEDVCLVVVGGVAVVAV